jgi:hypothetical protein
MNAAELDAEFLGSLSNTPEAHKAALLKFGIAGREIRFNMVATAPVRLSGDFYEPDPTGRCAVITPVRIDVPTSPESCTPASSCRFGLTIDLVAWWPSYPGRWALRTGGAEWLGAVEPQFCEPAPVSIRTSVLNWFKAGCTGLVLLSPTPADRYRILSSCRAGVIAEDREHARELRCLLGRSWPTPPILTGPSP